VEVRVGGKLAHLPDWMPARGWQLNRKGYLIYTSRKRIWIKRGERAHRAVMRKLMGVDGLDDALHIHHQDFDKLNCLPDNLVMMPGTLNPAGNTACRCAFTGRWLRTGQAQTQDEFLAYSQPPEYAHGFTYASD